MNDEEILPCAKHNVKPEWRPQPEDPNFKNAYYLIPGPKPMILVCPLCEYEKQKTRTQPEIDNWNSKNRK